jgi:hypothetical protein
VRFWDDTFVNEQNAIRSVARIKDAIGGLNMSPFLFVTVPQLRLVSLLQIRHHLFAQVLGEHLS